MEGNKINYYKNLRLCWLVRFFWNIVIIGKEKREWSQLQYEVFTNISSIDWFKLKNWLG